jgi:HSP20 family protein
MAVIRWNPGSELINLHSEMDRLFGELTDVLTPARMMRGGGDAQAFLPVDIERTEQALVIRASVPGFTPEEVNVTVDQGVVTIDAQHREEREKKEKNYLRQERFTGRLHRQILLGQEVDGDGARATFENGVLTVTVPLTQHPQPRRITVEPAASAGGGGNGSAQSKPPAAAGRQES